MRNELEILRATAEVVHDRLRRITDDLARVDPQYDYIQQAGRFAGLSVEEMDNCIKFIDEVSKP